MSSNLSTRRPIAHTARPGYTAPTRTFDPLRPIDGFLNTITMYRLIAIYLLALIAVAVILSALGILSLNPGGLLIEVVLLTAGCWAANTIFSITFNVPANVESAYITAFILTLIIAPPATGADVLFLGWAALLAMASKYILGINGKHLFNPVAISVVLTGLVLGQAADWWIGTGPMLPFVAIGGLLIVRKIRRGALVGSFLVAALLTVIGFGLLSGADLIKTLQTVVLDSPLIFFATVILTEPITTPPTERLQMIYGVLVGILFAPQIHIGSVYSTPELAIVLGNVYSYAVSPKGRLLLRLQAKTRLAGDIWEFTLVPNRRVSFQPGQYMEWTLGHPDADDRGNRRYFTLASSPTEQLSQNITRLGVKFYKASSSFKRAMLAMPIGTSIAAGQLAGDFTLPDDLRQPCVFIAGGIGVTPFRSMIKYMIDKKQRRPVTLFYINRTADEIVYHDVFDQAARERGIKTVYVLTDPARVPPSWTGAVGYLTPDLIVGQVTDYQRCLFYLSGPNAMVIATENMLVGMGIPRRQIRTDFFPGLA